MELIGELVSRAAATGAGRVAARIMNPSMTRWNTVPS